MDAKKPYAKLGHVFHLGFLSLTCDSFRVLRVVATVFADRCSDETAYSTGTESVARTLEVLVNQYDWLPGPLTFRVVKRLNVSAVGIVGITLG